MFERLCLSDMMMYEKGIVLSKKMDLERAVDCKAIMMLLTRIKEDLVLKMMPQFPSKMVMVGVLLQLRGNMKYVLIFFLNTFIVHNRYCTIVLDSRNYNIPHPQP